MSACFILRSAVLRSLHSRTGSSINRTGSSISGTGSSINRTGSSISGTGSSINRTGPSISLSVRPLCDAAAGKHQTPIVESTDEYKFVERLIPPSRVPTPPRHAGPAPCGWIPPADSPPPLPYMIRRSRMHNIPVYTDLTNGSRRTTLVRKVEGDIWALEKDVKQYLKEVTGKELPTQVNEVTMTLKVKGHFDKELKEWLAGKGF